MRVKAWFTRDETMRLLKRQAMYDGPIAEAPGKCSQDVEQPCAAASGRNSLAPLLPPQASHPNRAGRLRGLVKPPPSRQSSLNSPRGGNRVLGVADYNLRR